MLLLGVVLLSGACADKNANAKADASVAVTKPNISPDTKVSPYVRPAKVQFPPIPLKDLGASVMSLPKDDAGNPILIRNSQGDALIVDLAAKPSPVNSVARCITLLSWCEENTAGDSLDACWVSVPTCATTTPWNEAEPCCPAACIDAYEEHRKQGSQPEAADFAVLFDKPRCMPGLARALGEEP